MAGLIDMIRAGSSRNAETVVFVHTGGSAGPFAYRDALTGSVRAFQLRFGPDTLDCP